MSNDPVDGGTVTQQIEGQIVAVDFDRQTITLSFAEDARVPLTGDATVTFATPPEPAPLVVTCNGHSIDVPEWELDDFIAEWGEDGVEDYSEGSNRLATRFAHWLRDARQDPRPASEPEQDDTASGIDFDALPIGTVLTFNSDAFESTIVRQLGGWRNVANGREDIPTDPTKWRIAYFPPPLSPGECLRGLLAGRDDADRLLRGAAESWYEGVTGPRPVWWSTLRGVIGDAARAVHG